MKLVLIAAVAENGVIGVDGEMPWHYPADLKRFKRLTMGSPVVMGRKTYDSIVAELGEPLPGRTNVVVSRQELTFPEGAVRADGIEDALEIARETADRDRTVYVIGGETIYEQFLDRADELRITEIPETPDGDTFFPEIGEEWVEVDREMVGELAFVTYRRRS